jgi:Domain of unknown function (DUF5666)
VAITVLGLSVAASSVPLHAQAKTAAKTMTAKGTVKSVSGTSLVVTSTGKDMTFTVDSSTKFTGKGLTTKSKGAPMASTDAVHEGDMVSVSYHDMSGTMHAAHVTITSTKMAAKK